jgi:ABC-type transporter Mla MlaB component
MTAQRPREIRCDVDGLPPDAASLSVLARLQVRARRQGCELRFCGASDELRALAAFAGLAGVLGVEAGRQPEEREERLGLEEERHPGDAAV